MIPGRRSIRWRAKLARLLMNKIDYDGAIGKMTSVFMSTGIQILAAESDPSLDTFIQTASSILLEP